jgi:SAM-dependent methyltransferase
VLECHACAAPIPEAQSRPASDFVASDCQPVRADLAHCICASCGLAQKRITPAWTNACERIYADYRIYHQAAGKEQKARSVISGRFAARSELLTEMLAMRAKPGADGAVLDIGCGNGAFLRAYHEAFPQWRLAGAELNDTFRPEIESIAASARFFSDREVGSIGETFDLITLIHCLEHIPSPIAYLRSLSRLFKPGSVLLIQVPDAELNPFDLVIADHASHFSKAALAGIVELAGFDIIDCGNLVLGKEISCLAKVRADRPADPDGSRTTAGLPLDAHLAWIDGVRAQAVSLAATTEQFGIFGSSIAASWLAGACGDRLRFFVDEDPERVGKTHLGRPIIAPADIPAGATVMVALAPAMAAQIGARLASSTYSIAMPTRPALL